MPKDFDRQLTDLELEIMRVIWGLGECSIREVVDGLPNERGLAYTTVATMVKILEQKEVVTTFKKGRTIHLKPKVDKETYEVISLQHLNTKVFDGSASDMVSRLLGMEGINEDELKAIKKILNERLRS